MSEDKVMPEKANLTSQDIGESNRAQVKQMFPSVFTETINDKGELVESIDFEKLKAELGTFSDVFEARRERYGMDWPGKKDCMKLIQKPTIATLKPCREESVNFDETENLFIEGDNLEVLKLLQKSYYGKVKMIYIDPPYNTGKEFIYPDDYSESLETYLAYAGLVDDEGKKFSTNTANEGRFHSKWLNMMYPRLYLAKNLLCSEGVLFISIDDNEADNLRKLCGEIFGEDCFVADICVVNNLKGRNDKKYIATANERILMYVKSEEFNEYGLELSDQTLLEYDQTDDLGAYRLLELRKRGGPDTRAERPRMYYPFYVNGDTGSVALERDAEHSIETFPIKSNGVDGRWRWQKDTARENLHLLTGKPVQGTERYNIYEKDHLEEDGEQRRIKPKSVMAGASYSTDGATKAYRALMGNIEFTNPKPVPFIKDLVRYAVKPESDALILDFFAGSGTTAHAVLECNSEDGGNRKFIMVQLPEPCDDSSGAARSGCRSISDIGKERIRRVIKRIEDELTLDALRASGDLMRSSEARRTADLGFKVLKLDKSNFRLWNGSEPEPNGEKLVKQLEAFVEHVDTKSTQEDILFELLLKAGFKPTEKIEKREIAGSTVFSIAEGLLLICLEDEITKEMIEAIAEAEPLQFICLDRGFKGNDQLKANAVQTFAARNQGRDKQDQIVFRTV